MKNIGNIKCPHCGHINETEIPKDMWLMWIKCQGCDKVIWGRENPHGWNWVFCAYGDVPWLKVQEEMAEKKWKLEWNLSKNASER